MINVLLAEDSRIMRNQVEQMLAGSDDYTLFATVANAANAELICMGGNVQLVLMDVCTADHESGLEAAHKIKKMMPGIKIVIITSMPEYSFIRKAAEASCDGFWYKEFSNETLLSVMDRVMGGETVFPEVPPPVWIGSIRSDEFTAREMEVLRELCLGHRYEEIAANLSISQNTVKYHIKNLLQKTGYQTTMQLVVDAVDQKLIMPRF